MRKNFTDDPELPRIRDVALDELAHAGCQVADTYWPYVASQLVVHPDTHQVVACHPDGEPRFGLYGLPVTPRDLVAELVRAHPDLFRRDR